MLIIFLLTLISSGQMLNPRPVIGVITLPSELEDYSKEDYSTLDASYVKYIESAGAMVIHIHWDWTYEQIDDLFVKLNGILLTGGDTKIYLNETQAGFNYNKFTDSVAYLLKKVQNSNDDGKIFPVIGICQGFQILTYIISQFYPVLEPVFDNIQKGRLLQISEPSSYMFKELSMPIQQYISKNIGPFEFNMWGVFPETFKKVSSLDNYFLITSLSQDGNNQTYVSSIEGKRYPIYAFQFHPEMHQFEFASQANHTQELIQMGQHFINRFVEKSRQNENSIEEEELIQRVIYNYSPLMTMNDTDLAQSQTYVFNRENDQSAYLQEIIGIKEFQPK